MNKCHRNVSMGPLGPGRGCLGIRAAYFGNQSSKMSTRAWRKKILFLREEPEGTFMYSIPLLGRFMGLCTGVHIINPWLPWGFIIITFTHDLWNSCSCMNVSSFQGKITKKLRMLAAVRLKYFFSLSPSWKREDEKGKKNCRGEGPVLVSISFWRYWSKTTASFQKSVLWTKCSYGSKVWTLLLQYC